LKEHFPSRWIGRGPSTSPAPSPWPPHSPDRTTPDNSLWGTIKGRVAACLYTYDEELPRASEDAFRKITSQMNQRMSQGTQRRVRLCFQHQGAHTDPLKV
jgi:hypothetical protein